MTNNTPLNDANMRRAAPEMYVALVTLVDQIEIFKLCVGNIAMDRARRALAKARGEW